MRQKKGFDKSKVVPSMSGIFNIFVFFIQLHFSSFKSSNPLRKVISLDPFELGYYVRPFGILRRNATQGYPNSNTMPKIQCKVRLFSAENGPSLNPVCDKTMPLEAFTS